MKTSEISPTITNPVQKFWATQIWVWGIRLLAILVMLVLVAKVIFSLNIIWHIFNFPFQTDESEGMIVAEVHLMDGGANIYAQPTAQSFVSAPYPPLYYLLNWPFQHFGGLSFKPGRMISLVASVGTAFLLYRLAGLISKNQSVAKIKPGTDRLASIGAALFWATLGLVAFWGDAVKPDMTAVFFSLLGVYTAAHWANSYTRNASPRALLQNEGWLYMAALAFALAVLTKQTAFAGPLTVFVFVLIRRPLAALRFVALWLILGFGPMLAMNVLSEGGYWWHNVTVHQLPWTFENYWKFMGGFLQSYQLYFLLAMGFVISWLAGLFKSSVENSVNQSKLQKFQTVLAHNWGLLAVLYLGSSTVQGFSVGTYGGNHNHLLEMAAAVCLCAGLALAQAWLWWQTGEAKIWQRVMLPLVLILLLVQGLGLFVGEGQIKPANFPVLGSFGPTAKMLEILQNQFDNPDWLTLQYRVPPEKNTVDLGNVAAILNHYKGLVYSDNVSLLLAANKPLITTDPFTQTHATFYGRWDETDLLQMISQQKFTAIAGTNFDKQCTLPPIYFSPAIRAAVKQYYKVEYRDTECVFLPTH